MRYISEFESEVSFVHFVITSLRVRIHSTSQGPFSSITLSMKLSNTQLPRVPGIPKVLSYHYRRCVCFKRPSQQMTKHLCEGASADAGARYLSFPVYIKYIQARCVKLLPDLRRARITAQRTATY